MLCPGQAIFDGLDPCADSSYGRVRDLGLVDVGGDAHFTIRQGGTVGARLDQANFAQIREAAVATGLIDAEGIDRMIALLDDPAVPCASPTMFSVWGRRR